MKIKNVLFVCLGNICRSPACEGIAQHMFSGKTNFESAGTSAWEGSTHDTRSISVCKKHGIDISHHCGKQIYESDFSKYDLIVALDQDVLETLENMQPQDAKAKLVLFDKKHGGVDDTWYGGDDGFDDMYNQIERAMPSFLKESNIIVK